MNAMSVYSNKVAAATPGQLEVLTDAKHSMEAEYSAAQANQKNALRTLMIAAATITKIGNQIGNGINEHATLPYFFGQAYKPDPNNGLSRGTAIKGITYWALDHVPAGKAVARRFGVTDQPVHLKILALKQIAHGYEVALEHYLNAPDGGVVPELHKINESIDQLFTRAMELSDLKAKTLTSINQLQSLNQSDHSNSVGVSSSLLQEQEQHKRSTQVHDLEVELHRYEGQLKSTMNILAGNQTIQKQLFVIHLAAQRMHTAMVEFNREASSGMQRLSTLVVGGELVTKSAKVMDTQVTVYNELIKATAEQIGEFVKVGPAAVPMYLNDPKVLAKSDQIMEAAMIELAKDPQTAAHMLALQEKLNGQKLNAQRLDASSANELSTSLLPENTETQ